VNSALGSSVRGSCGCLLPKMEFVHFVKTGVILHSGGVVGVGVVVVVEHSCLLQNCDVMFCPTQGAPPWLGGGLSQALYRN